MRWILCLGGAACTGPATPPPDGTPPRPFVPFVGLAAAPDVTTDRLCAESADPDNAPDPAAMPLLAARAGERFELPDRPLPVWLDDGRFFGARPWSNYAHPMAWYRWVFAEELHRLQRATLRVPPATFRIR